MPNRERVALVLTEAVLGTQIWGAAGCRTMPDEAHYAVHVAADALVELVGRAIHWPRLLVEAEYRHAQLHDGRKPEAGTVYEPLGREVCGECLHQALLCHDDLPGGHDWAKQPVIPARRGGVDWAAVFAENIGCRREASS